MYNINIKTIKKARAKSLRKRKPRCQSNVNLP